MKSLCKHDNYKVIDKISPQSKFEGTKGQYAYLHKWVAARKVRPTACPKCGNDKQVIEWSNISGEYLKDVNDYEALCVTCHRKKDLGGVPKKPKEFCKRGHKMTADNTVIKRNGKMFDYRVCRTCRNAASLAKYHRRKYATL